MSRDLLYAAIKSVKIPDLQLKSGRYPIDETIHLQGEVIVGLPTFYQKLSINTETLIRICSVLNCSTAKAIKLFNDTATMSQEDIDKAQAKYGASIIRTENELKQTLPKKERKGSISGNIQIR